MAMPYMKPLTESALAALETWLSGLEHTLLLLKTQIQFPAFMAGRSHVLIPPAAEEPLPSLWPLCRH